MNNELRVKILGFNASIILNKLISNNVYVFNVKIKSKYIIFSIYEKDKELLSKICLTYKKDFEVISRKNIINLLKILPYKFGCLFACLIILCYMVSFVFIVYDIDIINETNVEYDNLKIESFLADNNICVGMNKNLINVSELENLILLNNKDISGCSVAVVGGNLKIKIYPAIQKELDENFKILYSKYDGVITNIDIISGKSNFEVGDIVKTQDVVIESNDNAIGKVYGNVYFSKSKIYNEIKQTKKFTGKFLVNKYYSLFNKNLFKSENIVTFSKYLEKNCDFYIAENCILPIKCLSKYYFEYEIIEEIVEFEKVEEQIKNELYTEVISTIPAEAKIVNSYYSVVKEGNLTRIDCFVETNVNLI